MKAISPNISYKFQHYNHSKIMCKLRSEQQIVPNQLVRMGPSHVVPLLTAHPTIPLGTPPGGILLRDPSAAKQDDVTIMFYQLQNGLRP
jgi:hypothetical protein